MDRNCCVIRPFTVNRHIFFLEWFLGAADALRKNLCYSTDSLRKVTCWGLSFIATFVLWWLLWASTLKLWGFFPSLRYFLMFYFGLLSFGWRNQSILWRWIIDLEIFFSIKEWSWIQMLYSVSSVISILRFFLYCLRIGVSSCMSWKLLDFTSTFVHSYFL